MKKQQAGFTVIEIAVVLVIVAAIAVAGYVAWQRHVANTGAGSTTALNYQSPPTTAPAAPQVSSSADLSSAIQALNQTSVSSSNTDSSQLSSQATGF